MCIIEQMIMPSRKWNNSIKSQIFSAMDLLPVTGSESNTHDSVVQKLTSTVT